MIFILLHLDFGSDVPIYIQIRNQMIMGIADGRLKEGERLPTVRALADECGINMMTVSKAYQLLKQEGYIRTDRRLGTIVSRSAKCSAPRQETIDGLRLHLSELRLAGMEKEEALQLCSSAAGYLRRKSASRQPAAEPKVRGVVRRRRETMSSNLIMWVSMIWMPVLMCAILRNEARFKKNIAVGVTLPMEAREDPAVLKALSAYKKSQLWVCIGLTAAAAACMPVPGFGVGMTLWFIWIDAVVVLPFFPYIRCNGRMKKIKRERGWQKKQESVANVRAAAVCTRWLSPWLFLLPLLISLLPAVYDTSQLPLYFADAAVVVLCFLGYRFLYRNKSETVDENPAVAETLTRIRRYNWGKYWLLCAWLIAAINLAASLTAGHPLFLMLSVLILSFAAVIAAVGIEFRTRRLQERLTAESGTDYYVDEDDKWIWGIFYYNPDDSHLIVNQRIGINTTVNLARRAGRIITGVSVLVMFAMPFIGIWIGILESEPVTLRLTETAVIAEHAGTHYEVPADEITDIRLLQELPLIQRVWGTGMDSVQKGTFSSEWGNLTVCLDPRTGPWLLISQGKENWLFGSSEQNSAAEIYAELEKRFGFSE